MALGGMSTSISNHPLLRVIAELRTELYARLAPIANRWNSTLEIDIQYPESHSEFIERCHQGGQTKPTPLLLQYAAGDYNCLHHNLYGEHVFPIEVALLLSEPGKDFIGGEFVLTEQRPRMQSGPKSFLYDKETPSLLRCIIAPSTNARVLSSEPPIWCEPHSVRSAPHRRHHFSRREKNRVVKLFDSIQQTELSKQTLCPGAMSLRGFALHFDSELVAALNMCRVDPPIAR